MPDLHSVRHYQPLDPYNHVIDNGPIQDIVDNLNLINNVLDTTTNDLADCIGTQGTLSNRLNVSLNADGSLKTAAVDNALHSIEEHTDTANFVRMTADERSKLTIIADDATDVKLNFATLSTNVLFDSGTIQMQVSDSVAWRVEDDGVYADVLFPLTSRHRHYYDLKPSPQNESTPDYQNYLTTSIATPYMEGSLRVYVNGVKISKEDDDVDAPADVKFPRASGSSATWISLNYTEDTGSVVSGIVTSGMFALSTPILSTDRIIIEFDVSLA